MLNPDACFNVLEIVPEHTVYRCKICMKSFRVHGKDRKLQIEVMHNHACLDPDWVDTEEWDR